jgi:kynureninase
MQNDTAAYSPNVDRLQKIVSLLRTAGITADIRFPSYIQIGSRPLWRDNRRALGI